MRDIKKISLNVSEEIKHILPNVLEKDLQDNEVICHTCHGLGVVKRHQPFGLKDKESNGYTTEIKWYDNEYLTFCPNCYIGVVRLCKYCGKPIVKGYIDKCDCEQYKAKEEEEKRIKYQETIDKATEIELKDASYYIYDEQSDKYFTDEDEFAEYYWDSYLDEEKEYDYNFDEYFEKYVPKVLWNCEETKISMDAGNIIDNACEELHEDARDNISDEKELQAFLDLWCSKQSGTTTYYPCYREYVKVKKEWFD